MPKLDRSKRDAVIRECAARYAQRLEHYCRLAPYNWFNFYDFWNDLAPGYDHSRDGDGNSSSR
jgi:predicted LPLAT superfamily acyltransferase